ncbi:MAG TPA: hypothetical protein VK308_12085, partial [Pyrinomonadaceae bacterium]|nr:hypothetical protein [Pyrinomonadaceae bacterium]
FGAAKGSLADTTLYSIPVATPGYAPIEQIHGRGTDARSDIFSAAATLYHLLAGEPPVRVVNRELALKNKNADPLPELYKLNSYTPKYLSDTVKKAMSLDPHDRVQTASDFLQIINLEEARHQKHSAIISGLQSLSLEFNCRSSTKDIHFEFLEAPDLGLFANFAGYGLKSGDVSAQMASEIFQEFFNVNQSRLTSEDLMSTAAERTNEAIYSLANEFPSLSGMEAGMAALHIQGDIATVCCLGSCAIYQLDSDGNFQKYPSEDFTKSLEAALRTALIFDPLYNYSGIKLDEKIHCKPALKKMNPKTNFFDRLGSRNKIEINIKKTKIKPDTIFILYTGKLQNFLGADDFQNFLSGREFAGKNLNEIRNSLRSKRFFEKTGFVLVKI